MNADYLVAPAVFLINTLFSLYIFALLLRFLFQWVDADYYNPFSRFLIKVTHPPLRLLRRVIPSVGRLDTASVVLMLALQTLDVYLVFLLQGGVPAVPGLAVHAFAQLLELTLNVFFYAIIIRALLSWVSPAAYNAASSLLFSLTEPLLRGSRRLLPPIEGIDLSPLIPLIGIQLAIYVLLPPLREFARALS